MSKFKTALAAAEQAGTVQELLSIHEAISGLTEQVHAVATRGKNVRLSLGDDAEGIAEVDALLYKSAADARAVLDADQTVKPIIIAFFDGLGFTPKV